jgi:hypothetical protein
VDHVHELGWSKKKDIPLLRDAAAASYDVFITNDANQFDDPHETEAIRKSRLHHVRYAHRRKGLEGLALAISAVVSAMPSIITRLEDADGQLLVHVKGIDPNNRFDAVDPQRHPPPYWR